VAGEYDGVGKGRGLGGPYRSLFGLLALVTVHAVGPCSQQCSSASSAVVGCWGQLNSTQACWCRTGCHHVEMGVIMQQVHQAAPHVSHSSVLLQEAACDTCPVWPQPIGKMGVTASQGAGEGCWPASGHGQDAAGPYCCMFIHSPCL
jgi:hypothetical protein